MDLKHEMQKAINRNHKLSIVSKEDQPQLSIFEIMTKPGGGRGERDRNRMNETSNKGSSCFSTDKS